MEELSKVLHSRLENNHNPELFAKISEIWKLGTACKYSIYKIIFDVSAFYIDTVILSYKAIASVKQKHPLERRIGREKR
jgi:hypothetical protein